MALLWLELLMFINFAFLTGTVRILGETLVQGTTGFTYLLVAYYFMRKSSKVLP